MDRLSKGGRVRGMSGSLLYLFWRLSIQPCCVSCRALRHAVSLLSRTSLGVSRVSVCVGCSCLGGFATAVNGKAAIADQLTFGASSCSRGAKSIR